MLRDKGRTREDEIIVASRDKCNECKLHYKSMSMHIKLVILAVLNRIVGDFRFVFVGRCHVAIQ